MKFKTGDVIIWNKYILDVPYYIDPHQFYLVGPNGIDCDFEFETFSNKYYNDLDNFISIEKYCRDNYNIIIGSTVMYKEDIIKVIDIRKWGGTRIAIYCDNDVSFFPERLTPILPNLVIRNINIDEILR